MSREKVIGAAYDELGYMEGKNNYNKYGIAYGVNNVPYCMIFLWWCFMVAGDAKAFYAGRKTASCSQYYSWAKSMGFTHDFSDTIPGDIALMAFDGTQNKNHAGIVVKVINGSDIVTIEGNTTLDNGGEGVSLKTRNKSCVTGIVRPNYLPSDVQKGRWSEDAIRYNYGRGLLEGFEDGTFRPQQPTTREEIAMILWRMNNGE